MTPNKDVPKVAIVVLNWNNRTLLKKFLPSVYNSNYPNLEFVLGDNNSTDDSVQYVRNIYPNFSIISNDQNLGFAGGYNSILKHVNADYFILLNSDVEVPADWITPVIKLMESDVEIAAVQPKIIAYNQKEKFEYAGASGGYIDKFGYPFCRGRIFNEIENDVGQYDQNSEIFWASGAALFIRSSTWKEVGGFDEDFFAHMEEIDLCWRLKRLGYKIMVCPTSIVYHVGGATLEVSNPKKTYLNFRNNLIMVQKNLPIGRGIFVIFVRLWLDLLAIFRFLIEGKKKDAWAVSRAHQYFFKNYFYYYKKRNGEYLDYNKSGFYKKLIIWSFFVERKTRFSELKKEDFE